MTDIETHSFDLRKEPWIAVTLLGGRQAELSLTEVLLRAHEIRAVDGEVPTQQFATIRLLLAVLYSALPQKRDAVRGWAELWESSSLPGQRIVDYLNGPSRAGRFDLLDSDAPFLQVAGLSTTKGEVSGLERLIADIPNGEPYFTTRRDAGVTSLSFAEAARWLVHCHAFDPSGIKSGAIGDDRVKGGKGYPIGTGWAGELGGVLIEGNTLKETLLLNLVLEPTLRPETTTDDLAVWDRPPLSSTVEGGGDRRPEGQADLFTWPSRRIRLAHDGSRVTGVLIANGDPLRPQNLHNVETMTSWRRSPAQEKKLGEKLVYMPRTHDPERALWRGLGALLPQLTRDTSMTTTSATLAPSSLEWLARLSEEGVLPQRMTVTTRAIGVRYGTQSSVIDQIIDDSFSFRLLLALSAGHALAVMAKDMIEVTDKAVGVLATLGANLAVAAGGDSHGPQLAARESAYFALDAKFRSWLAQLDSSSDAVRQESEWQHRVRDVLVRHGKALVDGAGPSAWLGRDRQQGGHTSSPEAYEWFIRGLRKALPAAYSEAQDPHQNEADENSSATTVEKAEAP